ncbi:MAG: PD-(D/E)XK nuclease family protein [Chloroflexi bacterium]|nr:PD-(D/E)XK nuclease family protein [Chloroflexota bacterium]
MADITVDSGLKLPPGFHFTQTKLQDFIDCPRRFYLKYVLNQQWPAPLTEPQSRFEERMKLGQRLHQLIERHQLGIRLEQLREGIATEPAILAWVDTYVALLDQLGPFDRHWPEIAVSAAVKAQPLVAKFDLLGLKDDVLVAIDWKTGKLPPRHTLARRMQTQVYLCVLGQQSERLAGQPVRDSQLVYASVATGETVVFGQKAFPLAELEQRLATVLDAIESSKYDKVPDEKPCRYCVYRGLCERGITPRVDVSLLDVDAIWELDDFDVESDTAIEF